jgi:hypothetical protein
MKEMTKEQIEVLDEVYQDSINTLASYWEEARRYDDPDILLDKIFSHYDDKLCAAFKVEDMSETDVDMFDFGPRDWLYENIDAGIK